MLSFQSIFGHLFRPLKGGAPSLIIIFSLGLTLAESAGLFGIALGVILTSWFWKYAFILFDHTVTGIHEPPALDIQMVNPLDEQRPLGLLLILVAMGSLCHALTVWVGGTAAIFVAGCLVFCVPAIVAVLALECSVLPTLDPRAWFRLIFGLHWQYLLPFGIAALYALLTALSWSLDLWRPVQLAITLFCSLSLFSLLAGLLYDNRDRIGLEVSRSPERTQEREAAEDRKRAAKLVDEAYGQLRSGQHVLAWKTITDWLGSRGHRTADYDWLCDRMETWGDDRYRTRLTEEFLEQLLRSNSNGQALDVLQRALRWKPTFRPKFAESTLRLAHIAAAGGAPKAARLLLSDFSARFPDDANVRAAAALSARLESQSIGAP